MRQRLDSFLAENGWFETKSMAQANILAGKVKINGETVLKAGTQINPNNEILVEIESMPYVSRGGFKLEKAAREFLIDLKDKICLDAGASTGGFVDFMLQSGAKKVYAVDVGYGQLAWKLRSNNRVVVVERTNIKNASIQKIYGEIQKDLLAEFCSADLSFISLVKVLENIKKLMNPKKGEIIALIKPQFEAGREFVPKSGVVKDINLHIEIIKKIADFACEINLFPVNLTYSPIQGPAGNIEYLIQLKNNTELQHQNIVELIEKTVKEAHEHFDRNKIKEQ